MGNDKAQMGEASLDPETDDLLRREVERLADDYREFRLVVTSKRGALWPNEVVHYRA